jgi:hypothetical protein
MEEVGWTALFHITFADAQKARYAPYTACTLLIHNNMITINGRKIKLQ